MKSLTESAAAAADAPSLQQPNFNFVQVNSAIFQGGAPVAVLFSEGSSGCSQFTDVSRRVARIWERIRGFRYVHEHQLGVQYSSECAYIVNT